MVKILGYSGLGRNFSRRHLPNDVISLRNTGFVPKFGYDPLEELLHDSQRRIEEHEIERVSSFPDLLERLQEKDGAIVINSPDNVHHQQTMAALEKGLGMFVEKPMGVTRQQCDDILAKIQENNNLYISGLCYNQFAHFIRAKEMLQSVVNVENMEGWEIVSGYHHNMINIIAECMNANSNFHAYQNYHLGGGIHCLSVVLDMMNSTVLKADPVQYWGKISDKIDLGKEIPNPLAYRGIMKLSNGARLVLETDVVPEDNMLGRNFLGLGDIGFSHIAVTNPDGVLILEVRPDELYFDGRTYSLNKDLLAYQRVYDYFWQALQEKKQPLINGPEFTYNCTVPIIDSLDHAGVIRTDLLDENAFV